jgi:hypothetical protein
MNRKSAMCVAIISSALIAGCQSSYINQPSSPLQVVTKTELTPNITVGEKIEATATVHNVLFFFSWGPGNFAEGVCYCTNLPETPVSSSIFGDTANEAKAAAVYKACTNNKADFIICPRYYIISKNYFFYRQTKAKVFGYKGVLLGVEKAAPQPEPVKDVQLIPSAVQITHPIQIAQPIKVAIQPEAKTIPQDYSSTK